MFIYKHKVFLHVSAVISVASDLVKHSWEWNIETFIQAFQHLSTFEKTPQATSDIVFISMERFSCWMLQYCFIRGLRRLLIFNSREFFAIFKSLFCMIFASFSSYFNQRKKRNTSCMRNKPEILEDNVKKSS